MAKPVSKKKQNRAAQQRRTNLTVIIIIAAFAVVVIGLIVATQLPKNSPSANVTIPTLTPKPLESGLNLGDPSAPVKVIEFADFQCIVCYQYWQQIEPAIISTYVATGEVYYTFSPFVIFTQNSESEDAAEAAYCANDQGKFWEYHDTLFTNYLGEYKGSYTIARLKAMAEGLGLDMTTFNSCLDSHKYASQIETDRQYAQSFNVQGTPSFLVNGTLVHADTLQATIDAALAASK